MAEKKNEYPASVEADRRLLEFETWEDYLDSLIEIADLRNLRSIPSARTIAAFGYRANGDTLQEKEFYKRRKVIHGIVYPTVKPYVLVSEGADEGDAFSRELAVRERANRVGILQSIIFIRHFTRGGFEISGYIDYAHRLIVENWAPFLKETKCYCPGTVILVIIIGGMALCGVISAGIISPLWTQTVAFYSKTVMTTK